MQASVGGAIETRHETKNRFRRESLAAAAGSLGAVSISPTNAEAGIHYDLNAGAGPGDSIHLLKPFSADYAHARIDLFLNPGGMLSFGLGPNGKSTASSIQLIGQPGLDAMGMPSMGSMAWHALQDIAPNDTVDGSLSAAYAGENIGYLMRDDIPGQGWGNGTSPATNYAGFQFEIGGTSVYGWMKVTVDSNTFTLDEWAYDNTGAAIQVGVIPEPSTALLLGLGLAGLAAAGAKKFKRSAESPNGAPP